MEKDEKVNEGSLEGFRPSHQRHSRTHPLANTQNPPVGASLTRPGFESQTTGPHLLSPTSHIHCRCLPLKPHLRGSTGLPIAVK